MTLLVSLNPLLIMGWFLIKHFSQLGMHIKAPEAPMNCHLHWTEVPSVYFLMFCFLSDRCIMVWSLFFGIIEIFQLGGKFAKDLSLVGLK